MLPNSSTSHNVEQDLSRLWSLKTDLTSIESIEEASLLFQAIVSLIKSGHRLDSAATSRACLFLDTITPGSDPRLEPEEIFRSLVPLTDEACTGFAEGITTLITCQNSDIVHSTLSLLHDTVRNIACMDVFDFIETGFFALLPQSFFLSVMALPSQSLLHLCSVVFTCLDVDTDLTVTLIQQERDIQPEMIRQSMLDNVIRPLEPFLETICFRRRAFKDSEESFSFSAVLGMYLQISPFHAHLTHSAQLSLTCFACTDCIDFFSTDSLIDNFLTEIVLTITDGTSDGETVRSASSDLKATLREEGISDEVEQGLLRNFDGARGYYNSPTCARYIARLGGNTNTIGRF
ncbi:hypothetical protein BLNAU_16947 [Blattamonas nauphoetae]|uniref:Uncharacterized protein n=1 Tax=Blattamonas nauphoetae TaxID=2049346 RepID=A0ABQ9XBV8_9EUKA|nr:hypothetical protein BLNAU_16947 [Blattamonas nauphoetae]